MTRVIPEPLDWEGDFLQERGGEHGQELTLLPTSAWAPPSLHESSTGGWTGTDQRDRKETDPEIEKWELHFPLTKSQTLNRGRAGL